MGANPFHEEPVPSSPEIDRIAALPRRTYTSDQITFLVKRMTALLRTPQGSMTLLPTQALGLWEIMNYGGLLGAISVGCGKELLCLLAGTVLNVPNPIELMPASLIDRSEEERAAYGKHFRIQPGLRLLSYSKLGLSQYHDALTSAGVPGALIFNEAHKVRNKTAAVTRRVRGFIKKHPEVPIIHVSGTLLSKSIVDFAPLVRHALKHAAPVPVSDHELKTWSEALDEKSDGWNRRDPGALMVFCNDEDRAAGDALTAARRGFQRRLAETPGVVSIGGEDVANEAGDAISIRVRAVEYTQGEIVEKHFETLRTKWETPNGWQLSQAMEIWAHAREIALGFHYEFKTWPPDWQSAMSPGAWVTARRGWCSFVRETLKHNHTLDSEKQVRDACAAGILKSTEHDEWLAIQDTFKPESRMIWHDDGALNAAVEWAQGGPGVIWTAHSAWARELSRRTGLRYFGQKGLDAQGISIDTMDPKQRKDLEGSCVIASMQANSTGRNLQFWSRGLVTASPANALDFEQLLGRFHRKGQTKDEVVFDLMLGCAEHSNAWKRSLDLARMTRDLLGAPQKLLLATAEGFPSDADIRTRSGWKWQTTADRS